LIRFSLFSFELRRPAADKRKGDQSIIESKYRKGIRDVEVISLANLIKYETNIIVQVVREASVFNLSLWVYLEPQGLSLSFCSSPRFS
jgi:hypothetical protein